MANTYYQQSPEQWARPSTFTVGELMRKLNTLDPNLPVIFKSPEQGCYRPNQTYSLDSVQTVSLEAYEIHNPAGLSSPDEETGERTPYEAWTDYYAAWNGVVIG